MSILYRLSPATERLDMESMIERALKNPAWLVIQDDSWYSIDLSKSAEFEEVYLKIDVDESEEKIFAEINDKFKPEIPITSWQHLTELASFSKVLKTSRYVVLKLHIGGRDYQNNIEKLWRIYNSLINAFACIRSEDRRGIILVKLTVNRVVPPA